MVMHFLAINKFSVLVKIVCVAQNQFFMEKAICPTHKLFCTGRRNQLTLNFELQVDLPTPSNGIDRGRPGNNQKYTKSLKTIIAPVRLIKYAPYLGTTTIIMFIKSQRAKLNLKS